MKPISSKGEIKIPDYKRKEKVPETVTEEDDIVVKAWKMMNTAIAEKEVATATNEDLQWYKACKSFFDPKERAGGMVKFPFIKNVECGYGSSDCVKGEKLKICHHDVMRVMKGSKVHIEGDLWVQRLKNERLRWHPDKFSQAMGKKFENEAKEMFQMIQRILKTAEN